MNTVTLIGRIGKDPEVKHLENSVVGTFSLATTKKYKKDGERVEETQWHNIVIWGKGAEIAEKYLKKGSKIALRGEIRYRTYESEGVKKYFTEIYCLEFEMLDKKPENQDTNQDKVSRKEIEEQPEDDLPF